MWVKPREILISSPMWDTDRTSMHFILQRRKGRGKNGGKSISGLLVSTLDSVLEVRPPPYRSGFSLIPHGFDYSPY